MASTVGQRRGRCARLLLERAHRPDARLALCAGICVVAAERAARRCLVDDSSPAVVGLLADDPAHSSFRAFPVPHLPGSPLVLQYVIDCATALIGALALARAPRRDVSLDRCAPPAYLIVVGGALVPASARRLVAGAFLAFGGGLRDLARGRACARQRIRNAHTGAADRERRGLGSERAALAQSSAHH